MTMTRKFERDLILSDTIMCAVLKRESDAIGITLEEYIDRFLEVFYTEPLRFYSMESKANGIDNERYFKF